MCLWSSKSCTASIATPGSHVCSKLTEIIRHYINFRRACPGLHGVTPPLVKTPPVRKPHCTDPRKTADFIGIGKPELLLLENFSFWTCRQFPRSGNGCKIKSLCFANLQYLTDGGVAPLTARACRMWVGVSEVTSAAAPRIVGRRYNLERRARE
jgi:hypothetical protein